MFKNTVFGKIELLGMEFTACHGCLELEQMIPNRFVVDFSGECEMTEAIKKDDLEGTIDYSRIYDIIAAEMAIPSKTLEHLAGRIYNAILKEFKGCFLLFSISIAKQRPPVKGVVAWSRITLNYPD